MKEKFRNLSSALLFPICAAYLSGCAAPDILLDMDLSDGLRQTAHEMRLRGAHTCTAHQYEQSSGRKLTGDVKIATKVTIRRLYLSDDDWVKAEMIGNGVIDNIFYSPKIGKFICGQKTWDSYTDTKNIVFHEYGISEKLIGLAPARNSKNLISSTEKSKYPSDSRPLAVSWDGYDKLISGIVDIDQNQKTIGIIKIALPNNDGNCSGQSKQVDQRSGVWSISCTNGMVASGTYEAYGDGKGASGIGTDLKGKQVKYTIAPRN